MMVVDRTRYFAVILIFLGAAGLIINLDLFSFSRGLMKLLALTIAALSLYQLYDSLSRYQRGHNSNLFEIMVYSIISLICLAFAFRGSLLISYWNMIWPIGLIVLGIITYLYLKENPEVMDFVLLRKSPYDASNGLTSWEPKNPIVRALIAIIVTVFTLGIVFFTIFGAVTPILAVVFLIVGGVLFFTLGITFLAVIIPLAIILSPVIFIIWLLSLIF